MDDTLILGRYRPLAILGEGGHGTVELAFDTRMARRVAIKRVPVTHRGFEILTRSAGLAEARIAALLNHPHIVTMYEWDTDDDEAFLIMEHVDGAPLSAVLARFAPLDADEAAAVLAPVAEALGHAHANGVMHLDLKPDNVLITRDGLVKVADFGVASLTNAAGQAISAGGTLGYMPPEQLRGEAVDAHADVWAFGALALEVLTGALPFAADDVEEALDLALGGFPRADTLLALDPAIESALAGALAPEVHERTSSIGDVATALLAHLGDPSTGRARLAELIEDVAPQEEPAADERGAPGPGPWVRLAAGSPSLGERLVTAAGAGLLAWAGTRAFGLGDAPALLSVAIASAAGAAAPTIGLAVGLLLLVVGAFVYSLLIGIVVAIAAVGWWLWVGRRHAGAGAFPALAPVLAMFGLAPALPLLAGVFVEDAWTAAAAGALAGLAGALLPSRALASALLPGGALLAAAAAGIPGTLGGAARVALTVAASGLAALLTALGVGRGTRFGAAIGGLAGLAVMIAATGPWLTGGTQTPAAGLLPFLLALILGGVVIAAGPLTDRERRHDHPRAWKSRT